MRLGGWFRLWIAASGLYAVTLGAFTVNSWPVVDDISHHPSFTYRMPQAAQAVLGRPGPRSLKELEQALVAADKRSDVSEAKRLANEILARRKEPWGADPLVLEMPNGHKFEVAADTKTPDVDLVSHEYVNVLKAEQENRQQQLVLHAFLFWVGPVLAAGLLGATARWVYTGFIAGR